MVEKSPAGVKGTIQLENWWIHDSGIPWGSPGDFDACVVLATKVFAEHAIRIDPKGWCSNLHVKATGGRPGHAPAEEALKHG